MKDLFPGYYRPTEEEFKQLWNEATFSVDANILLNIYRYSPDTRKSLFTVLRTIGESLWIPHQVALEYHRNRINVLLEQQVAYEDTLATLAEGLNKIELIKRRHHPSLDTHTMVAKATDCIEALKQSVEREREGHPDYLSDDPLREELAKILENKIGKPYPPPDLDSKHYKDAEKRYKDKVPPGYAADSKEPVRRFGDYILWRQLLDHVEESKIHTNPQSVLSTRQSPSQLLRPREVASKSV